jgi:hypothetical protein
MQADNEDLVAVLVNYPLADRFASAATDKNAKNA